MSGFRLFCFKQFFKVHVFCLLMMVIFRLFMHVQLGFMLWMAIFFSTLGSGIYLSHKPYMITKDIYAIMAVSSCLSLSIIAQRFLWIAFRIDLMNMMYFFLAMFMFAFIAASAMKLKRRKKKKRIKKRINWLKRLSYIGWGFLMFLFFYQLMLSYLLRPNFLTVMALSISHGNLLLIMWTYVDVKQLYEPRKRRR